MKKTSKRTYLVIIICSILISAFSLNYAYTLLGGYTKLEVYISGQTSRLMVGRSFRGRQTSAEIEKFYIEMRDMVLSQTFPGTLAVVNFQDSSLAPNEISQFIGVILEGESAKVPMQYELREFQCTQKLAIFLTMHPVVMPMASEVEQRLRFKADSLNIALGDFIFEIHYPDDSKVIEAWSKN
ncbi:MAG: hypothetical protein HQ474_07630 [Flammeovirgaceae bacterium]|nr:hypothetical protein [Flammeovirgaceae bacterium]